MTRILVITIVLFFAALLLIKTLVFGPFWFLARSYRLCLAKMVGQMPPPVRRVLRMHDENGLIFDSETLSGLRNEVVFWPVCRQAELADSVCISLVKSPISEEELRQFTDFDKQDLGTINATAIGNAAYLALNSKHQGIRRDASHFLERVREYFEAFK